MTIRAKMDAMAHHHDSIGLTLGWLLGLALLASAGCVSETRRADDPPQPRNEASLPVEVLRIPQQLQDVSGDLLRYHARHRALPPTLDALVEEKIMSPDDFAALPDYLYSPTDRYTLRDGRIVILVDSEVRIEGHAWCIVREPDVQPRSIQLNVTPVTLSELDAATRARR